METWVTTKPTALMTRTVRVEARRRREKEKEAETKEIKKNEKNGWQLETREKKINKIINASTTITVHICTITVAIVHLCTFLHLLMWVFFGQNV